MAANICSAQMRVNGWSPILLLNSLFAAGLIVWKRQGQLPPGKKTCAAARFMPLARFADRHRGVLFLLFAPPILLRKPMLCFCCASLHGLSDNLSKLMSNLLEEQFFGNHRELLVFSEFNIEDLALCGFISSPALHKTGNYQ